MIRFNVFGQRMLVQRKDQHWLLYKDSETGIRARVYDVVIPDDLKEQDLASYLDDIYHEFSSEKYPTVLPIKD